jgi:hypothetical protein
MFMRERSRAALQMGDAGWSGAAPLRFRDASEYFRLSRSFDFATHGDDRQALIIESSSSLYQALGLTRRPGIGLRIRRPGAGGRAPVRSRPSEAPRARTKIAKKSGENVVILPDARERAPE